MAIGWCLEAGVLLVLGLRLRADLLQRAGQIVWTLSLLPLMQVWADTKPQPPFLFLNERALPLLLSLIATGLVVLQQCQNARAANENSQPPFTDRLVSLYSAYVVFGGGVDYLAGNLFVVSMASRTAQRELAGVRAVCHQLCAGDFCRCVICHRREIARLGVAPLCVGDNRNRHEFAGLVGAGLCDKRVDAVFEFALVFLRRQRAGAGWFRLAFATRREKHFIR